MVQLLRLTMSSVRFSKRPKKHVAACCHCGNTLHISDACPLATIDIIEDDLSDKNMSDVTVVEIDESDEKNNSKKKKESKAKSAVSEPGSSSKSEGSNTKVDEVNEVNDEPEEKSSKRKRETRYKSEEKSSKRKIETRSTRSKSAMKASSKDEDSNTKVDDEPEEKSSKRKRETRSKSAVKESGSSSKGEGSNTKENHLLILLRKNLEWLKNSQSIPVVPISIPIENVIIQSNTESDHSPAPTQNQNATERVFVAPYYVDLDAYRQELRDEEQEENEDSDNDENESFVLYGNAKTKIVGIQYYNGIINKGEAVTLIREPSNPYDKNAIRVDNIMCVQVGHIPRDVAAALAPLTDNATIIGIGGVYQTPLQLHVYGLSQAQESISNSLKRRGIAVEPPKQPRLTKKSRAEAASRGILYHFLLII
ncbi:hypothetical protein C2G38_2186386 [Gigaspora rosea]|uniref:HIRAN domain-containing protein n=1 Tax=Gigaspora rosea TaxID=44941 RepID=A0A397V5U0_9GLOM|nr:hypothetical protein C2G38_2186386 [Gigaspora rosea]